MLRTNKNESRLSGIKKFLFIAAVMLILPSCSDRGEIIGINEKYTEEASSTDDDGSEAAYGTAAASFTEEGSQEAEPVTVHVCGAVKNSGVYSLEAGSRIADAIKKAGGFSDEADETYLNLALRVSDGSKIYVPTIDESASMPELNSSGEGAADSNSRLVNINTADENTLKTIAGIGDSRARDIINYREMHGEFKTVEDIMKVKGIKKKLFDRIKDLITV